MVLGSALTRPGLSAQLQAPPAGGLNASTMTQGTRPSALTASCRGRQRPRSATRRRLMRAEMAGRYPKSTAFIFAGLALEGQIEATIACAPRPCKTSSVRVPGYALALTWVEVYAPAAFWQSGVRVIATGPPQSQSAVLAHILVGFKSKMQAY